MLDFEKMVHAGARVAGQDRVILAAAYDMSPQACRIFAKRGLIEGYIAGPGGEEDAIADPLVRGEWVDRANGWWRVEARGARTILFFGSSHQVTGTMLKAARQSGIRRIIVVHSDGTICVDMDVGASLIARAKTAIIRRIASVGATTLGRIKPISRLVDLSYDRAYDLLYNSFQASLRLPKTAFIPERVLIIGGSLGPGGAERQIAYTAAGVTQSKQYEVFVGCNFLEPPADFFKAYVEASGTQIERVPHDADEFRTRDILKLRDRLAPYDVLGFNHITFAVFHYALLIHAIRPSVVHTWMDYCNVLAGIAADMVGVPALVQSGRSLAPDNFSIFQPYMRPGYLKLRERRATILLNNSHAGARDYSRWLGLPLDEFQVIHNGFDFSAASSKLRIVERRNLAISDRDILIGSIIRFSEEKNPKVLIKVARRVMQQHRNCRFVIFGEGPMLQEMRSYTQSQGLSQSIQLPGYTRDAWASLAAMDIFLLASRMEGLPNVLVEAQASGLPIVCTDVGGTRETYLAGETGIGVPAVSPVDLAKAVSRLIEDPGLRGRMSNRAREFAREKFGMDRMVDETINVYRRAERLAALGVEATLCERSNA